METIFISGVQTELAAERKEIFDFINGEPLIRQFFEPFLFERLPASDQRPDDTYLDRVEQYEIYLGIFGNEYGREDASGFSPTEKEYLKATNLGKYRIILVTPQADDQRHPRMRVLIERSEKELIRRRFTDASDLTTKLYEALIEYLTRTGKIRLKPLDAAVCSDATIDDISPERVVWFLQKARDERNYPLAVTTSLPDVLIHLNLLDRNQPTCGAILLFGKSPQRFFPAATVKCLHFYGIVIEKPIPSYQIYTGTLFEQVDKAVDFVMSNLARSVIPSDTQPASGVLSEIPYKVVREAVVNAVAHRDYSSNASVQVTVFVDRVEIRNSGSLPSGLTPDRLRNHHSSIPRYPLICNPLYLTHYIEQAGTGTLDMITLCQTAGIPEPDFEQQGNEFVVTLWRDWLSDGYFDRLHLNERQRKVIGYLKSKREISNTEYRKLTGASVKTASRDLDDLAQKGLLNLKGVGRGAYYLLMRVPHTGIDEPEKTHRNKQDINRT